MDTNPNSPHAASGLADGIDPDPLIKEGGTETFISDVIEASNAQPVIVDFWAPWCGPCRQMTPLLERLVSEAAGAVRLVKINIDDHPQISQQMQIQSIPAVVAFQGGKPVDGFMGAQPESQIRAFIDRLGGQAEPSPVTQLLEMGGAAVDAGDLQTALQAFTQALAVEPDNERVIAGLAKTHLALGEIDQAAEILDSAPEGAEHTELVSARAALDLARQAQESGDVAPLRAAVAAHPDDLQARFDLAIALNGAGEKSAAIDHLIHIIAADREWNDQAARKELLKFFEAYGQTDPMTLEGRRKLSTVLFS